MINENFNFIHDDSVTNYSINHVLETIKEYEDIYLSYIKEETFPHVYDIKKKVLDKSFNMLALENGVVLENIEPNISVNANTIIQLLSNHYANFPFSEEGEELLNSIKKELVFDKINAFNMMEDLVEFINFIAFLNSVDKKIKPNDLLKIKISNIFEKEKVKVLVKKDLTKNF